MEKFTDLRALYGSFSICSLFRPVSTWKHRERHRAERQKSIPHPPPILLYLPKPHAFLHRGSEAIPRPQQVRVPGYPQRPNIS